MLRRAWIAIPAILGLGALYGALSLRIAPAREQPARARQAAAGGDDAAAGDDVHVRRARTLIRSGSAATASVVEAYGAWAKEPDAVPARRLLLRSLFRRIDAPFGIESALAAIEADPTPAGSDPLWSDVVEQLASAWKGSRADRGLDLLVSESRPRARRAVIASFAHLVSTERSGELSEVQRQTLINHMIDLQPGLSPDQQPEVDQTLRVLAGDDVADILLGHGLHEGDELDGARERNLALAEASRGLPHDAPEPQDARSED